MYAPFLVVIVVLYHFCRQLSTDKGEVLLYTILQNAIIRETFLL